MGEKLSTGLGTDRLDVGTKAKASKQDHIDLTPPAGRRKQRHGEKVACDRRSTLAGHVSDKDSVSIQELIHQ